MSVVLRPFRGEADLQAMSALVRDLPAGNLHVVDLPWRLGSWALDDPDNVGLWVDAEGQLVAWAVMQTPFWQIDYACHPGAGALHPAILAWADRRARQALGTPSGRPCWFVPVLAGQVSRIRDLEAAGFASQADVGEDSWSQVLMRRPGGVPVPDTPLPPGFSVRPLAGASEVAAYVELHRAVFESRNMTVEWRARTLRRPEYQPDLDVVAVTPDGSLAAFCVGWFLRHPGGEASGQIEPLGVAAEYRHLGLGRLVLSEVLRRLQHRGASSIYVETDNYRGAALDLYESVGFEAIQDVWMYRQDYEIG